MKKGNQTIQINPELHKRVKLASFMEGKSITTIVEEAVEKYVSQWDIRYTPVNMDKDQLMEDLAKAERG